MLPIKHFLFIIKKGVNSIHVSELLGVIFQVCLFVQVAIPMASDIWMIFNSCCRSMHSFSHPRKKCIWGPRRCENLIWTVVNSDLLSRLDFRIYVWAPNRASNTLFFLDAKKDAQTYNRNQKSSELTQKQLLWLNIKCPSKNFEKTLGHKVFGAPIWDPKRPNQTIFTCTYLEKCKI